MQEKRIQVETEWITAALRGEKPAMTEADTEALLEAAVHHRLVPQLAAVLSGHEEERLTAALQPLRLQHMFFALRLAGETSRLAQLFNQRGVELLMLKGPALASFLYGDTGQRMTSDIDMLVPPEALDMAACLLRSEGYEENCYFSTVLPDWKWRHHHRTFYHSHTDVKVELHWRLHPGPGKEPAFRELADRSQTEKLGGVPVPVLGNEDLFSFLSVHGARHGWSRLRWLYDIHQLMKRKLDFRLVKQVMGDLHPIGASALILSGACFGTALPVHEKRWLMGRKATVLAEQAFYYMYRDIELHAEHVSRETASYHQAYQRSLLSWRRKMLLAASFFYPYPEDVKLLPLPERIHFLYVPIRPFLWAWRRSRRASPAEGS
ncbi:nucleotidyltransferase domain-containing protein [Alkalicoccus luteus]|uniref:nucleotidyltransferase domain-containing protein n=1 Tax=Alkalicoccus luteus TaxID=1237094 RepID=UPI00403470FB